MIPIVHTFVFLELLHWPEFFEKTKTTELNRGVFKYAKRALFQKTGSVTVDPVNLDSEEPKYR